MSLVANIKRTARILRVVVVRKLIHTTRKIKVPGFQGISLWEIIFFFVYSLQKGLIGMRAGAVAFHFFLALIPFGLVLVVLTTYTPGINLEADIAPVIGALVPDMLFEKFLSGIHEYENSTVTSLISFGFVFALYFTSNGFSVLIKAFNSSRMSFVKRQKWWAVRLLSVSFVLTFIFALIITFYILIFVRKGFVMWAESNQFVNEYFNQINGITNFIFLAFLVYCGISLMYYFGPKERKGFRFFSPGATLAFILVVIISVIYELYITYYASYNELYGSLGTIIMLLIWIYMISFALLIGFELNASIHGAMQKKRLSNVVELEERYDKSM
ncbi:MAG: YihY/virulence factor BrkB family protein [Crocinitomicaceae bacterium]|nr:YihY/virulence factor BrkB family protein [Crocinitomicaceae bacterium]